MDEHPYPRSGDEEPPNLGKIRRRLNAEAIAAIAVVLLVILVKLACVIPLGTNAIR